MLFASFHCWERTDVIYSIKGAICNIRLHIFQNHCPACGSLTKQPTQQSKQPQCTACHVIHRRKASMIVIKFKQTIPRSNHISELQSIDNQTSKLTSMYFARFANSTITCVGVSVVHQNPTKNKTKQ